MAETRLFSKQAIASITVGTLDVARYKVEEVESIGNSLAVRTVDNNTFVGWLTDFLSVKYDKFGASIYAYKPEINKERIIILPHVFIEFMTGEFVKHVFNTNEELDAYLVKNGLRKMLNSNHFFNPYNREL